MHDTAQTMKITGARFPGRYIQATGLIARLGVETKSLGTNGFAILDCALAEMLEIEMTAGAGDDIALSFHTHGGECSEEEVEKLTALAFWQTLLKMVRSTL